MLSNNEGWELANPLLSQKGGGTKVFVGVHGILSNIAEPSFLSLILAVAKDSARDRYTIAPLQSFVKFF